MFNKFCKSERKEEYLAREQGNLQLAAWDWIIPKKMKLKKIKIALSLGKREWSGLSQFLFLQQKMKYVDLMAIFIIFLLCNVAAFGQCQCYSS